MFAGVRGRVYIDAETGVVASVKKSKKSNFFVRSLLAMSYIENSGYVLFLNSDGNSGEGSPKQYVSICVFKVFFTF